MSEEKSSEVSECHTGESISEENDSQKGVSNHSQKGVDNKVSQWQNKYKLPFSLDEMERHKELMKVFVFFF